MMTIRTLHSVSLILGLLFALSFICRFSVNQVRALETRSQTAPVSNSSTGRQSKRINSDDQYSCGTTEDLVNRVDFCAKPVMDLLSGSMEKWPRTEDDAMGLCDSFGVAERCVKDAGRRCGKGIQKTIVSTIGSSIQRVRRRECSRAKAASVLKATQCIEKNQKTVRQWMLSVTSRLDAIETQQRTPEKKINSICCIINDIETEIKTTLEPHCPSESKLIQRVFRAVVDNAVDIVCRQPKCNDYLKGLKMQQTADFSGLIAIILRVVFSLDAAEA